MCQRAGKPVVVDPARGVDFIKYQGASFVTPNRAEAELASGVKISDEKDARSAAEILIEKLGLQGIVITLDKQGMVFLDRGGNFFQFSTRPRYVYDVTGAGDMVMSIFGFVLAGGGASQDAVELANVAGGVEVEKIGVTPLSRKELQRESMDEKLEEILREGRVRYKSLPGVRASVLYVVKRISDQIGYGKEGWDVL